MTAETAGSRRIVVTRVLDVPPERVWALLADPARHPELDGSGSVREVADARPITGTGQVFTMQMHLEPLGDYRTDNTVVGFDPGREIIWATARAGQAPPGLTWAWRLAPEGGGTAVTHTYDWSGVTDPAVLARVRFPRISREQLEGTLDRLAAAAATPTG